MTDKELLDVYLSPPFGVKSQVDCLRAIGEP